MSLGTLILCVVLQKYLTLHSSEGLLEGGPFSHISTCSVEWARTDWKV